LGDEPPEEVASRNIANGFGRAGQLYRWGQQIHLREYNASRS
jgi:hypothetical protein